MNNSKPSMYAMQVLQVSEENVQNIFLYIPEK
jgi:hypothetical protein